MTLSISEQSLFDDIADELEASSRNFPRPVDLAREVEFRTIQTPALDILDDALVDAAEGRQPYLIFSMPPQEGKSYRVSRTFPLWMLTRNPDLRIAVVSYSDRLARRWGKRIRNDIAGNPQLGLSIRKDTAAADEWQLNDHEGGVITCGLEGSLTGRPVDVLIIDDPIKGMKEAESETYRENAKEFWRSTGSTRLSEGAIVVVIQCMAGDTAVLMATGAEKPLRDIRPGDQVATYEEGKVTFSTVRNWANQGPDSIYSIRMKSGVVVRANARHPFLTIEDGKEVWRRTDLLQKGSSILRVTGGSGAESPAPLMSATIPPSARACACPTTTGSAGRMEFDPRQLTRGPGEPPTCGTGTASKCPNMNACSRSREGSAQSVESFPLSRTPERIGTESSASITTMKPERSGGCSATTATLPLGTEGPRRISAQLPTTYSVECDEVVEVVASGVEDVYDLQIDRTENFIANGLVSHNTRWHEDDFAGWLKAEDPEGWRYINIPAQADHDPAKGETDILGREPGEFMQSARGRTLKGWLRRMRNAGSRVWQAVYQGRPSPAEGGIFKRNWWITSAVNHVVTGSNGLKQAIGCEQVIISVDATFKDTKASDYVCMQVWGKRGSKAYLLDQVHDRMDFPATCTALVNLAGAWPQASLKLIEDKANGPAIISQLRTAVPGIVPFTPVDSKVARANAIAPFVEAGNVEIPAVKDAPWVGAFIEEAAAFPAGAHDDRVDAMTQALHRLFLGSRLSTFVDQLKNGG